MFKDMDQDQSVFAKLDDFLLFCFFSHLFDFQDYQNVGYFPQSRGPEGERGEKGELKGFGINKCLLEGA